MVSRTATLRLQMIDAVSGPGKNAANSLRGIDNALSKFGKGGTPEVKRLVKQLEHLQKKAGSIEDFTANRRGFKDLGTQMGAARSNVARMEQALKSASKPTAKMRADLDAARSSLRSTSQAFRDQGNAVRQSERALHSYGIAGRRGITSSQQAIRSEIAKTIREMRRLDQEARKPKPPRSPQPSRPPGGGSPAYDAVQAIGGGVVANGVRNQAQRSFFLGIDFDQAAAFQAALGDFKGDDRKALNKQAEKIGGDTRFSNVDVVRAQTTVLQRGIRDVKTIQDLTAKITDYSLAMGVTLEEGAEAVTGSALSKRIDIKDTKAIGNFVDFMVWMAKNGGMSNEDVSQFIKYGGAPTTGARLPDEMMAAMGMILRRSGVRGDEAGVFARSAASKLVAPTQKGRDALAAMGIDFNAFTSTDAMNTQGIEIMMKNKFGERLTTEMKQQVADLINNGEFTNMDTGDTQSVISDSGEFVSQMSQILGPLFAGKNGKMSAMDANKLAKALSDYQKYSVDSVDATGLLNAIAKSDPTLGNLNAFFTDKQGGRANMIFQQWPLFQELLKQMQNVPGGVANKIGTEANQGIYGDWTKLTGSVETALTRMAQDWEVATRPLIRGAESVVDGFTQLSDGTRRLVEVVLAASGLIAGAAAAKAGGSLLERLMGGGGGAAAGAAAATTAASGGGWLSRFVRGAGKGFLPVAIASTLGDGSIIRGEKADKIRQSLEAQAARRSHEKREAAMKAERIKTAASPIQTELRGLTGGWSIAANIAMSDYVAALTNGGSQAEAEAQRIGDGIKEQLQITAHPDVDTGRLERALTLARQLAAVLRGEASGTPVSVGSTAGGDATVGGKRDSGGRVRKGSTYAVGGKGVELFTPGQDGFVTPNGQIGNGGRSVVVNMKIHIDGAKVGDPHELAHILERQLNRAAQTAFANGSYGDK